MIRRLEHLCSLSYDPVGSVCYKLRRSPGNSRDGDDDGDSGDLEVLHHVCLIWQDCSRQACEGGHTGFILQTRTLMWQEAGFVASATLSSAAPEMCRCRLRLFLDNVLARGVPSTGGGWERCCALSSWGRGCVKVGEKLSWRCGWRDFISIHKETSLLCEALRREFHKYECGHRRIGGRVTESHE